MHNKKQILAAGMLACFALGMTAQETVSFNFDWKFAPGQNPGAEAVTFNVYSSLLSYLCSVNYNVFKY